jgi:flavin-dependent dehydrogenase
MSLKLKLAACVIGGGPAGAATARRLAQLGHSVVVVEKQIFPRAHVGESISPGVLPLLDVLGIKERVEEQAFLRPERVLIFWPPHRGYKPLGPVPGFQVDRAKFDAVMLDSVRETGALVLDGAQLVSSEQNIAGSWDLMISWRGELVSAESSFVVDATGRRSLMRSRKRRYGARTVALWNYWRQCAIGGSETRVEAGAQQWYWGAPLPDGSFNATVFIDRDQLQRDLQRLGSVGRVYQHLLTESELLAACLDGKPDGPARVCDATCYFDRDPLERDVIKVGEALFSIDPLSSQGVQAALGTALHAAAVVNTALRRSENRKIADRFYRERQQEAVTVHRSMAASLYLQVARERPAQFWLQRARIEGIDESMTDAPPRTAGRRPTGRKRLQLATEVQILSIPCIDGDFIVERQALVQPGLGRPTVFLCDVAVAPLLHPLRTPLTVDETLRAWSRNLPRRQMLPILNWFWENGVITEVS